MDYMELYVKPSEIVREIMATPGLRKHLTFGHDDVGDGAVHAFNQSPFHKEPFKWMYNTSFYHQNVQYSIGDSVMVVEDDNEQQLRIESLDFRPPPGWDNAVVEDDHVGKWLPHLYVTGLAYEFDEMAQELVLTPVEVTYPAGLITERIHDIDNICHYQTLADGSCVDPRTQPQPERTFRDVVAALPFVWLAFYIDKYGSSKNGNQSTEALYCMVCNVHPSVYGSAPMIFDVMLLPHGCNVLTAMGGICEDLRKLAKTGVYCLDSVDGVMLHVRAAIAILPADSPQAYLSCRGMGASAKLNGRACALPLSQVGDSTIDCRDHTLRRCKAQTDVAVAMMQAYAAKHNYPKTKIKVMRKYFGLVMRACVWELCPLDAHLQSFWDGSHLIWFGVFKNCLAEALIVLRDTGMRTEFIARIQQFCYPRGLTAPLRVLKDKLGAGVTMEGFRTVCMLVPYCGEGIFPDKVLKWFVDFRKFAAACFSALSVEGVTRVQEEGRSLIRRGVKSLGNSAKGMPFILITGQKPNTHGLLEFVIHTLPALRNGMFADCRVFEKKHGPNKAAGGAGRGGRGGGHGESVALHWSCRRLCLRDMLLELYWFGQEGHETFKYTLAPYLLTLRDYRKGKEHNAHPLIQSITGCLHVVGNDPAGLNWATGEAGWLPKRISKWRTATWKPYKPKPSHEAWTMPPAELEEILRLSRQMRELPVPADALALEYCLVGKAYREVGARRLWVHVNDAVEVHLHGQTSSWCRVKQIVCVRQPIWFCKDHNQEFDPDQGCVDATCRRATTWSHRMWVIPDWYCPTVNQHGDVYTKHKIRMAPLVQHMALGPDEYAFKPILANEVQVQVCVTHSCIREGHNKSCGIIWFCKAHNREFDTDQGCVYATCRPYMKDCHDLALRPVWEIINRESGMSGFSTRGSH